MPSAPPAVFAPPSGSTPAAPEAVFTPISAGGSPTAPAAVFSAPGGGSPSSPAAVFSAPGGGSPSSPAAVFSAPGGGSPSAPDAVFSTPVSETLAVDFTDSENPDRDGRYVYLGIFEGEIPVWARDDGTTAIVADVLTGAGLAFIQRDNGSGDYVWNLEDGSDWETTSPTVLMTHLTAADLRSDEPTPADAGEWFDTLADGPPESITITLTGLASPPAIFTPAAGGTPSSPAAVFTPITGASEPSHPPRVFGLSADMVLSEAGDEITTESSTTYISTEA